MIFQLHSSVWQKSREAAISRSSRTQEQLKKVGGALGSARANASGSGAGQPAWQGEKNTRPALSHTGYIGTWAQPQEAEQGNGVAKFSVFTLNSNRTVGRQKTERFHRTVDQQQLG